MKKSEQKHLKFLGGAVALAYLTTAVMILLLAVLLYKVGVSYRIISAGIIATVILSNLLGGRFVGRKIKSRKFLWGLAAGVLYFLVLAVLSLLIPNETAQTGQNVITALLLCTCSGMLGGMLA